MKNIGYLFLLALVIIWGSGVVLAGEGPSEKSKELEATTYQIRNVKQGELLRPKDANSANGTPIVLYPAQPWKCMTWRLQPSGESAFRLKNLFTSKTFCAATNNISAQQNVTQLALPKDGRDAPLWQFMSVDENCYKIADPKSGAVLTAVKDESSGGFKVVAETWQNLDEQKWKLEKIDPKDLTM